MSAARGPQDRPILLVTGASGFMGRHLLDALKDEYRIIGLARRSQQRSGAPVHPNIRWYQADIGDRRMLAHVFRDIAGHDGAHVCIHLAAHYDFTGDDHPEYERTNVQGTRHVLEECRALGTIRHFVFSSSVAACRFPPPGGTLNEHSAPDGEHIYARTKREGERMLGEFSASFQSVIVRFAAAFSDWCEYPPLFVFISTWLGSAWNRRMLGGRGESAIPYVHVQEIPPFFRALLHRVGELQQGQVLICGADRAVNHRELYESVTEHFTGRRERPFHMPKAICGPGMQVMDLVGQLLGERPFERPWMAQYIDEVLAIDSTETRRLLHWGTRPRLEILRRMPFLMENLKVDPLEWQRRNRAAMKHVRVRSNLRIHQLLEKHESAIAEAYNGTLHAPANAERFPHYQELDDETSSWNHRMVLHNLMNAVRTRERAVFMGYCHDIAEARHAQGFTCDELCGALETLSDICTRTLLEDPEAEGLQDRIFEHVTMTLRIGVDQVQQVFDDLEAARERTAEEDAAADARDA